MSEIKLYSVTPVQNKFLTALSKLGRMPYLQSDKTKPSQIQVASVQFSWSAKVAFVRKAQSARIPKLSV